MTASPETDGVVRRTWGRASVTRLLLCSGEEWQQPASPEPASTLVLCMGDASLRVDDEDAAATADPTVLLHPGATLTLHARSSLEVLAVQVPEPIESVPTHHAAFRVVDSGEYTLGIAGMVRSMLSTAGESSGIDAVLVERILREAVAGVAVRY